MSKAQFDFDLFNLDCTETEMIIPDNVLESVAELISQKYSYPETRKDWIEITRKRLLNLNKTVSEFLEEGNKLNSLVPSLRSFLETSNPKTFDNNSGIPYKVIDFIRRNFDRFMTEKKTIIDILREFEAQSEA